MNKGARIIMFSVEFWAENWIKLLFGLLSAGIIAYVTYLHKKFKQYRQTMEEKDEAEISEMIEDKIQKRMAPVMEELEEARTKFNVIKDSYRYRLLALCEIYLNRGYLTPQEYH